jgi:hypothetical protein
MRTSPCFSAFVLGCAFSLFHLAFNDRHIKVDAAARAEMNPWLESWAPPDSDEGVLPANLFRSGSAASFRLFGRTRFRHNVAIILDTGASMNVVDQGCGETRIACELSGVRELLMRLLPCRQGTPRCDPGSRSDLAGSSDEVSLFVIPNVTVDSVVHEYDCGKDRALVVQYIFPMAGASSYTPVKTTDRARRSATYQIVGYGNDYRLSNRARELNQDSDLVRAVGGKPGCPGTWATGGMATYYAGAIYAAQASLVAEQAARPGSKNILILVSDGSANSARRQLAHDASGSGLYPSWVNECGQAIDAAKASSAAGTRVYSVGYGAGAQGCLTDQWGAYRGYTPCQAMRSIASSSKYFYSAPSLRMANVQPCISKDHRDADLKTIFKHIARSIDGMRSEPNGST